MTSYILFHQTTGSDLTDDETSDEGNFCFLEFFVNVLKVYFCSSLFIFSSCITESRFQMSEATNQEKIMVIILVTKQSYG